MAVNQKHPLYAEFLPDWVVTRDTYRGERVIKSKTTDYLPATAGMISDGAATGNTSSEGFQAYASYLARAVFPSFMADAVQAAIGVMHRKPPIIKLPKGMEPMREKSTTKGESLETLLRRINEHQIFQGRYGLLLDLPVNPTTLQDSIPFIATYVAESILNWDDGAGEELRVGKLNLVVLDESSAERQSDFTWDLKNKYRVLALGKVEPNESTGTYTVGVFKDNEDFAEALMKAPGIRGKTLNKIPFVFVNSKDIVPEPDEPPLLGLARLCLAIYRLEADYRQALFMQGQDTLVVVGDSAHEGKRRLGAGASIEVPVGGDAKFIGVDSDGLPEMREALENDRRRAGQLGGQLLENGSKQKESGETIQTRIAAQTATLTQIALTGAFALETILKIEAEWLGLNPAEVEVKPNLDFANEKLLGKTLVEFMTAKRLGAPMSLESIHRLMKEKDLTKLEFEEELAKIESEAPIEGAPGTGIPDENPMMDDEEDEDEDEGVRDRGQGEGRGGRGQGQGNGR